MKFSSACRECILSAKVEVMIAHASRATGGVVSASYIILR